MATSLVILSSSPVQPRLDPGSPPSSPGLPSPSALFRQARPMERPQPSLLPRNAIAEFRSAADLLRDDATQRGRRREPKAVGMAARETPDGGPVGEGKKARKKATKKGAGPKKAENQGRIKPMKVTKVVRDTAAGKLGGKRRAGKKDLTALEPSTSPSTRGEVPGEAANDDQDLLLDAAVRRRVNWTPPKNNIPTIDLSTTSLTSPVNIEGRLEEPAVGEHPRKFFKDLLGSFVNERAVHSNVTTVQIRLPAGTRKRQRTELVDPLSAAVPTDRNESANDVTYETAPVEVTTEETVTARVGEIGKERACTRGSDKKATTRKPPIDKTPKKKAPRKKPKTITEQAIRPYGVQPALPSHDLQGLAQKTNETRSDEGVEITAAQAILPPKRKAKPAHTNNGTPKAKPASRRKKAIESSPPRTLLSPLSAFKKMDEQVVLFGTSSQLVREDSPPLVLPPPSPSDRVISQLETGKRTGLTGGLLRKRTIPYASNGGLWSAASREFGGSLMEIDVIDLATTPKVPSILKETKTLVSVVPGQNPPIAAIPLGRRGVGWSHIDSGHVSPVGPEPVSKPRPDSVCSSGSTSLHDIGQLNLLKPSLTQALPTQAKRANPAAAANPTPLLLSQPGQEGPANVRPQKPDFVGYSTAQLSSALVSYGFKPIKNRNQMITLLEKCWEGKNRVSLKPLESGVVNPISRPVGNCDSGSVGSGELVAEELCASVKAAQTAPIVRDLGVLKKPRGRPKKPSPASTNASESLGKDQSKTSEHRPMGDSLTAMENTASKGVDPSTPSAVSPKRPRGRPRGCEPTETSTSFSERVVGQGTGETLVTEIATQQISSNGRSGLGAGSLDMAVLPPAPGTPSTADSPLISAEPTPALSDEARQQRRFDYISRAITSQPPPENACSAPSFHQKILMYDPVVLEDLAAWLNTKGLADIGVDTEVGAAEVRAWCEQNSICCLWKGGLWGGTRSRY
ncbi:MAG: 5'-flap endonuclease [Geoglossum umbratile]|nr:MAG: 5'-flap endonuclease [Geoglossum umbratile]